MRIGEVAARAGVNAQTLRYYERRGILGEPDRRASGYRDYGPEAVRVVRFIKRVQRLGFTLAEVEGLLRLRHERRRSCAEVRSRTRAKLRDIEGRVEGLRAVAGALEMLLRTCTGDAPAHECPILGSLNGDDDDDDDDAQGER